MIDTLQESVEQFMDAVEERVAALEQETRTEVRKATSEIRETLSKEGQPGPEGHPDDTPVRSYAGVWADGRPYERGTMCTDHGSTWIAVQPTMRRPGLQDSGWRLIAKGYRPPSKESA